jgi:predicted DNA-binding transcriptional regulator AlpA
VYTETSSRQLLSRDEAALELGIHPKTLYRMHKDGKGPPRLRVSPGCVRYRLADLHAWLNGNRITQAV